MADMGLILLRHRIGIMTYICVVEKYYILGIYGDVLEVMDI